MNTKSTLILAIVAAAVFGAVLLLFKTQPTTHVAEANAGQFVQIDRNNLSKITITNPEGEVVISKQGDTWMMERPVKGKASLSMINQVLTSMESLKGEDVIDGSADDREKELTEFGLKAPAIRVKLEAKNGTTELIFGKPTAIEGRTYAGIAGKKEAYVVRNDLPNLLKGKPEEFRDRKLTDVLANSITRVVLKSPAGEIELTKTGEHWEVIKPLHTRGDDSKINDLVAKITNAQVSKFVSESAGDLAQYGLAEPKGSVQLFGGGEQKPVTVLFGKSPENDHETVYVKVNSTDSTYAVNRAIEDAISARPNDLRDKNLVRLNMDTVDHIHIRSGDSKFLLARKGEGWELKDGHQFAVDKSQVDALATALNSAQITGFVADTPTDAAKYGLDQPSLQITFSAFSSENTPESPAGEQKLATISFGKTEGQDLYVRVEEDPFIFSVNPSVFKAIATDPLEWQEKLIVALKPEDVESISEERAGKAKAEVIRGEQGKWDLKSSVPADLNVSAIESVVASVKRFTAVRWVGSAVPEYGLDQPEISIQFTLKTGEPKTATIKIGAQSPEGMRYASFEGKEGVFLISRPQYDNLTLPLFTARPSAAPTASPEATPSPTETPKP